MLVTRLATGLTLVAVLLSILIFDERFAPWFPLWLVASLAVSILGALELSALLSNTDAPPSTSTVLGGTVAIVLANWAPHAAHYLSLDPSRIIPPSHDPADAIHVLAWPLWTFVASMMVAFLVQSLKFREPGGTMPTIASTVLAMAYMGLLGSFMIQFRWFEGPYHGLIPLANFVAVAKGSDIGAYTLGRLAGRRKLWPILSPNKTIEGALGGLLFGVLFSLIVTAIARFALKAPALDWLPAIGFGLVVAVAAQLGDLMESMIKRDCEVKDASSSVPGFGGVLDVLDSLLFAAPVAYGFWVLLGP